MNKLKLPNVLLAIALFIIPGTTIVLHPDKFPISIIVRVVGLLVILYGLQIIFEKFDK